MRWELQYASLLQQLVAFGHDVDSREGPVKELSPAHVSAYVNGWHKIAGRGGSGEFAEAEQLCYLAGAEPDVLAKLVPRYREMAGWMDRWPGAYGPRLVSSLPLVVEELATRPNSRRAVAPIWRPLDLANAVRKPRMPEPCTLNLQFLVRHGQLHGHATMRSCDAWYGIYYDVPAFMFLTRCVGWCLGLRAGAVHLGTPSLHLYERHWDPATNVRPEVTETRDLFKWAWDDLGKLPWRKFEPGEPVAPVDPAVATARWLMLVRWAQARLEGKGA